MIHFHNNIIIKNSNNDTYDFDNMLSIQNSLYIKNSSNLIIIINNKINKIIVEKSNSIYLIVSKLITGVEINNSNNIILEIKQPNTYQDPIIPSIELDKSKLILLGSIDKYLSTLVNSYKSEIHIK
jgi:hypothetical protein